LFLIYKQKNTSSLNKVMNF